MSRLRLGVALMVPEPVATEVDGLRRALGDPARERIAPHITLVPPVNVAEDRLHEALDVVRSAASGARPFAVHLGPPTTFSPDSPVVYLPVTEGHEAVHALRAAAWRPPLSRSGDRPFVPHVTVCADSVPDRIGAAISAMADYGADVSFDRVALLVETPGRVWVVMADPHLGPPAVVGRGGLPLELTRSEVADPVAESLIVARHRRLTVTARRDGEVVGVIRGWHPARAGQDPPGPAEAYECVVAEGEEALGTPEHLRAALRAWLNELE